MRIVIDLQGAQSTGSRNRGIGRYSLSLAQAIVRNRGQHEVIIALSGLFPDTIEPIREEFKHHLPSENISVWQAKGPLSYIDPNNNWRREAVELVYEAFLASLNPSVVLVSSLFEGLIDDAVTSIGSLSHTTPTAVVLFDLIPLINRSPYLDNPKVAEWYESKIDHLKRANLLLSISESSRKEGIEHLKFSEDSIFNISTAADSHFEASPVSNEVKTNLYQQYGINLPYLMYTGGIDHRKNIEGLIRAYASLPSAVRKSHQLAIVCSVQPNDRARLDKFAEKHGLTKNELVLTGYVPDEELLALYNMCKAFIFPSWHEGFGLPALEAMACGRAVIAANTSSLPEVIGFEDAMFDPFDDNSIAKKIEQVLMDDVFRISLEKHALEQAKKFSWDITARSAISAMEKLDVQNEAIKNIALHHLTKPRLAYVSPLPPERSGISDYSAELIPSLAQYYNIEVIVSQTSVTSPWINQNCAIRSVEWFREHYAEFDRVLYHFGNSTFHQHMFSLLGDIPGVVVLHDFFLSGILAHMEFHSGEIGRWISELYAGHGYAAVNEFFKAKDSTDVILKYPCNYGVLQNSQGVIVHSDVSRDFAREWYGKEADKEWAQIPLLRSPCLIDSEARKNARNDLGLNRTDIVICSFGHIGVTKLNHRLLNAWHSSGVAKNPNYKLIFVGENDTGEYGQQLLANIRSSEFASRIRITGWTDTNLFHQYLAAADVGVQLRSLSRGETSAAVLDCMNYGLPTIVNGNGSMAYLDQDSVWKLPDEFADAELENALIKICQDQSLRFDIGSRAQRVIHSQHAPSICAVQYWSAIERFKLKELTSVHALTNAITQLKFFGVNNNDYTNLAEDIDRLISPSIQQQQLLLDISDFINSDAITTRSNLISNFIKQLLYCPTLKHRLEPVYKTSESSCYFYARSFTLAILDCNHEILNDEPISYRYGDFFCKVYLQKNDVTIYDKSNYAMMNAGVEFSNIAINEKTNLIKIIDTFLQTIL